MLKGCRAVVLALVVAPLGGSAPGAPPFGPREPRISQQPLQQQTPPPPQQKVPPVAYETGVDLILVDVNVLDREGKPVDGLEAADFKVSVNGRPRRIQTVQFITQVAPAAEEPAAAAAAPRVSSNEQVGRGRLFMIVVDEANLSMADARALDEPLEKFFSTLGPRDRVALVTVPAGGPRIDFTSDAARVRRALEGIAGLGTAMSMSHYNIGLAEAFAFDARSLEWGRVIERECANRSGEDLIVCQQDVEADARSMVVDARQRASASLGALYGVVRSLASVEGPKTLVFVSGGVVVERQDAMTVSIAAEAAAANTAIYVLHLERPLSDASVARPSPTLYDDLALGRQGLELVAGRARGEVFRVPTSSEFALARIATETSGYYLLGVDAEPADRDGRTHQVRVELASSRRGLTLRSRREFRYDRAAAGGTTDEERLGTLLGSPTTVDEMPIRASAYVMGDPARGRVQLHVAAEIGTAATSSETMVVGFMLVDESGRPRGTAGQRLVLEPVDARGPSPLRYTAVVSVEPGDYTLKLAAIDPDGRRGSIEHPVRARLTPAGPLQLGDLFVLDAPRTGPIDFRPEVFTRLTGQRVAAYCEMYGPDASAFAETSAAIEIAASEDGPTLIGGKARPAGTEATRRMVQVAMGTSMLPPGDYVARVVVAERGEESARLVRGFRVERPAAAAGMAGGSPEALPRGIETVVPKPVFERETLLRPEALAPFLDQMGAPASPLAAAGIAAAREGRFAAILEAPAPAAPDLAASFLRGLALFARGDLNDAAIQFRAALRASGDFFPAAFFLGACHAAAGHDTEAAGAWQVSLITQEDVPIVYEMLSDALVRLGRYQEASDILEEAASRFPEHEPLEPRRAAVALGLGDSRAAFGRVAAFLERHPDDVDALFLALRLLYEAVSSERWILGQDEDVRRMEEYVRRYRAAGGPHVALVERWLKR